MNRSIASINFFTNSYQQRSSTTTTTTAMFSQRQQQQPPQPAVTTSTAEVEGDDNINRIIDQLHMKEDRSSSPVPTATSSVSEHSFTEDDYLHHHHANANDTANDSPDRFEPIPPSRTFVRRKLSSAVVTKPDAQHQFLTGRPRIFVASAAASSTAAVPSTATATTTSQAAVKSSGSDTQYPAFVSEPAPLRREAWEEGDATGFQVRSTQYLRTDHKEMSLPSVFQLWTTDLVLVDQPLLTTGMCGHPQERVQQALRREAATGVRQLPPFVFAVNLCIPAAGTKYYHFVAYFGVEDVSVLKDTNTPLGRLAQPFFFGGTAQDAYRNDTFKLIPRIVQGNIMIRKAVGSKPTILGRKLQQHYVQDSQQAPRYLELLIDIGSCKMAQRIVKCAHGCAKSLVVDMMFVLEGKNEQTLPERILGGVRLTHLDFKHLDGQRVVSRP